MTAARTTLAPPPAAIAYAAITPTTAADRHLRGSRPRNAPTVAATIAMFQPLMATMWLSPEVVKSAASVRSTSSLRPSTIPDARPASGLGQHAADEVARRAPPFLEPGEGGGSGGQALQLRRRQRSRDPGTTKVLSEPVVWRRAHATRHGDAVARHNRRKEGQARIQPRPCAIGAADDADHGPLDAVPRTSGETTSAVQGPVPAGSAVVEGGAMANAASSHRDGRSDGRSRGAFRDPQATETRASSPGRDAGHDEPREGHGCRSRCRGSRPCLRRQQRRQEAPGREPPRARHVKAPRRRDREFRRTPRFAPAHAKRGHPVAGTGRMRGSRGSSGPSPGRCRVAPRARPAWPG